MNQGKENKPKFGCAKGRFKMSEDFDAPLKDLKEKVGKDKIDDSEKEFELLGLTSFFVEDDKNIDWEQYFGRSLDDQNSINMK